MIYPEFLHKHETIGISAPSAGAGNDLDKFQASVDVLKAQGYEVAETRSVRSADARSADAEERGKELTSLFLDPNIKMVMCAKGGDFLDECLPFIDFRAMKKHPKWLMGASDPTSILFPYTVKYDVASIYGMNGGSYGERPMHDFVKANLELIKGKHIVQRSYPAYMSMPPWEDGACYDVPSHWLSSEHSVNVTGRCIGGCIDCLKDLIGTEYDTAKKFVRRYSKDGSIWYFDNFSLSAENLYRTLLQFSYAGWFENTKAVIIGRTLFPSSETGMTYEETVLKALPHIPVLYQADIGHTYPHMTMINGAILHLIYHGHQASLSFALK
jgi:muramoyltetrapeptide carboxypeptidase LdcA involved in peptidoglycan recycling